MNSFSFSGACILNHTVKITFFEGAHVASDGSGLFSTALSFILSKPCVFGPALCAKKTHQQTKSQIQRMDNGFFLNNQRGSLFLSCFSALFLLTLLPC